MKRVLLLTAILLATLVTLTGCEELLSMLGFTANSYDLEAEDVFVSTDGGSLTIQVYNAGTSSVSDVEIWIMFSTDLAIDHDDQMVGARYLNVGASFSETGMIPLSELSTGGLPDGTYTIGIIVDPNDRIAESNEENNTAYDSQPINVIGGGTGNQPPVANISVYPGENVYTGMNVSLDGLSSYDPEGAPLYYSWSMTQRPGGSTAALSSTTSPSLNFDADMDGEYVIVLNVADGEHSSTATVSINSSTPTSNMQPVANAGGNQSIDTGDLVTLDGSMSYDPNVTDTLSYQWIFTLKPGTSTASLSGATTISPTFTADAEGSYVLELTVDDGSLSSTDSTVVTATTPLSTDATLMFLSVEDSGGALALTPSFDGGITFYTTEAVPNGEPSININAGPNHTGASVTGTGIFGISVGTNAFTVEVTAEDGLSTQMYDIEVTRLAPTVFDVAGTVSFPFPAQPAVPYAIVLDIDADPSNGFIMDTSGFTGSSDTSMGFNFIDIPEGMYYLYAHVDQDSSGLIPNKDDFLGFYGMPDFTVPPGPNVDVSATGPAFYDFTAWHLLPNIYGDISMPYSPPIGVAFEVVLDDDGDMLNGEVMKISAVTVGSSMQFYEMYEVPTSTFLHQYAWVDVNDDSIKNAGDFVGYFGTSTEIPPGSGPVYFVSGSLTNNFALVELQPPRIHVATTGDDVAGDGSQGNPYQTIQKGIDEAVIQTIGEVRVQQGTYDVTTPVTLANGVIVRGAFDMTWIHMPGIAITTIRDMAVPTTTWSTPTSAVNAPGTTDNTAVIEDFTILGSTLVGQYSAGILSSGNPIIRYNIIDGGAGTSRAYGIFSSNASTALFESNDIFAGGGGTASYGIYNYLSSPRIQGNQIDGGTLATDTHGIMNSYTSQPLIINNVILGGGKPGGVSSQGIIISDPSTGSTARIYNNTIDAGNGGATSAYGISLGQNSTPEIRNNIILDTGGSTISYGIYESDISGDPATLRNNDLFGFTSGLYFDADGGGAVAAILTTETLPDLTGAASGNVSFEPYLNVDYTLMGTAVAEVHEGGLDLSGEGYNVDFWKNPRTTGTPNSPANLNAAGWTMGAFEYYR